MELGSEYRKRAGALARPAAAAEKSRRQEQPLRLAGVHS